MEERSLRWGMIPQIREVQGHKCQGQPGSLATNSWEAAQHEQLYTQPSQTSSNLPAEDGSQDHMSLSQRREEVCVWDRIQ